MNKYEASREVNRERRFSIVRLTGSAALAGVTRAAVAWLLDKLDHLIH
jgi:hypothetical protein